MNTDPLNVLRKSARLWENRAASEQARGEEADLKVICEAMDKAATWSAQIVELEHRLGIATQEAHPPLRVEIIEGMRLCRCSQCGFVNKDDSEALPPVDLDALRARDRKAAKAKTAEVLTRALKDAPPNAPAPAHDVPLPVGPAPRTESVHDEGSYATERGNGTRGPGSVT